MRAACAHAARACSARGVAAACTLSARPLRLTRATAAADGFPLGAEGAGVVAARGAAVTDLAVGDAVTFVGVRRAHR
jgi:Zn-dependent alcohol dehydrogenase